MRKASKPIVFSRVFQIRIVLKWLEPAVWRRILVPETITLARLHDVIQIVMGWTDSHLHVFHVNNLCFGVPDPYEDNVWEVLPERRAKLGKTLGNTKTFDYLYDFGDSWEHTLFVEDILVPNSPAAAALCVGGENSCPPEDVGGTEGYMDFLEAISNPVHPEHHAMLAWCGGLFSPKSFDIGHINDQLSNLKV